MVWPKKKKNYICENKNGENDMKNKFNRAFPWTLLSSSIKNTYTCMVNFGLN